jgi:hypothetical protein
MLGLDTLALLGLSIYLILAPVWMLSFGISLFRKPVPMLVLSGS